MYQDLYDTGQPRRPVGLPFAFAGRCRQRHLGLHNRCEELHDRAGLEMYPARANRCASTSNIQDFLESHRQPADQDTAQLHRPRAPAPARTIGPGNSITGCVGDRRGYLIDTSGIDLHDTPYGQRRRELASCHDRRRRRLPFPSWEATSTGAEIRPRQRQTASAP